jgi:hypothetical protein
MDYPWTVLRVARDQGEGSASSTGPWTVAWKWHPTDPVLVLSSRILQHLASSKPDNSIGLRMGAQQEDVTWIKVAASAHRIKEDINKRVKSDTQPPEFACRVLTKEELDRWKIETEMVRIASESGNTG